MSLHKELISLCQEEVKSGREAKNEYLRFDSCGQNARDPPDVADRRHSQESVSLESSLHKSLTTKAFGRDNPNDLQSY